MEDFLNWELTNRMHNLGYDGKTLMYIDDEEDLINDDSAELIGAKPAILTSAAFRWFREKHSLHVNINPMADSIQHGFIPNGKYSGTIDDITIGKEMVATDTVCLIPVRDTHEEAELACLDKLIEIVESKQKEDGK